MARRKGLISGPQEGGRRIRLENTTGGGIIEG